LFNNAIEYLKESLELNPNSDYAHDRLSRALKSKEEEEKKLKESIREGKVIMSQFNVDKK